MLQQHVGQSAPASSITTTTTPAAASATIATIPTHTRASTARPARRATCGSVDVNRRAVAAEAPITTQSIAVATCGKGVMDHDYQAVEFSMGNN